MAVGLKDFVAHGISQKTQIAKEGSINLARIPKINSVVGILGHLGGTHEREVCNSIRSMAMESLAEEEEVRNRLMYIHSCLLECERSNILFFKTT